MPCKIPTEQILGGGEFYLLVSAFGGTEPSNLEFHFGISNGKLWMQKVDSATRLTVQEEGNPSLAMKNYLEEAAMRSVIDEESE